MNMSNGYYRISDKYSGNGLHVQSRISMNGEIKQQLCCVCKICGKDYPVKNSYKNRSACCPDCRKELKKLRDKSE